MGGENCFLEGGCFIEGGGEAERVTRKKRMKVWTGGSWV